MGCASAPPRRFVLMPDPPADVVEVVPAQPGPEFVWIGGHYRWDGGAYAWISGHWGQAPAGYHEWVAGHWVRSEHRWLWVEGHWR
jgi:hypothetical protein